MVHHIDAIYDEAEGLYYPPRQALGFNPQLKLNDSLLAYSYAEAYDISFPEALQRLSDDVEQLVAEIKERGQYEIDDIGVIRLNTEGAYEFEPFESGVLTPSLYGLSSFAIDPQADYSEAPIQTESAVNELHITTNRAADLSSDAEASEPADSEYIRIPKRVVRYAAVACVALMLLLIIPLPTNTIMQTLRAGQMDSSLLYRMFPKTSTTAPVAELKTASAKPKAESKKATKEAKPAPKAEQKAQEPIEAKPQAEPTVAQSLKEDVAQGFTIVLASKVSKANAEDFVKRIAAKGYREGRVVEMSQGYRVVYGSYKNHDEASKNKQQLENQEMFEGCWIMEL